MLQINKIKQNLKLNFSDIIAYIQYLPQYFMSANEIFDVFSFNELQKKRFFVALYEFESYNLVNEKDNKYIFDDILYSIKIRAKCKPDFYKLLNDCQPSFKFHPKENICNKEQVFLFANKLLRKHPSTKSYPQVANMYNMFSRYYYTHGNYKKALKVAALAHDVCDKFALVSVKAQVLLNEAKANHMLVKYGVAIRKCNEIIDICVRQDPFEELPIKALAMEQLSISWLQTGLYDKALELAKNAYRVWKSYGKISRTDKARVLILIGEAYMYLSNYRKAEKIIKKGFNLYQKVQDKNSLTLADTHNSMGLIYTYMGKYKQSIEHLLDAKSLYEKVLKAPHYKIAIVNKNITLSYIKQGNFGFAMDYASEAEANLIETTKYYHPDRALIYNQMSVLMFHFKDLLLSVDYNQKALKIFKKLYDEGHPGYIQLYNSTSQLYEQLISPAKALNFLIIMLKKYVKIHGENNPVLRDFYTNMATFSRKTEDFKSALNYQTKAIEITQKALGKSHVEMGTLFENLSLIYHDLNQIEQSLDYQKKSLFIHKKYLNANHLNIGFAYKHLASLLQEKNDVKLSMKYANQALDIYKNIVGENHLDVSVIYTTLSFNHRDLQQFDQAIVFANKAIDVYIKNKMESLPEMAILYNNSSEIYMLLEDYHNAKQQALKALKAGLATLPKNHILLGTINANVSLVCLFLEQLNLALRHALLAIDIFEAAKNFENEVLLSLYQNVSVIFLKQKKYDKAKEFEEKRLLILQQAPTENIQDLVETYDSLAELCFETGDLNDSINYLEKSLAHKENELKIKPISLVNDFLLLSRELRYMGKTDVALRYLHKVNAIIETSTEKTSRMALRTINDFTTLYHETGNFKKALESSDKAFLLLKNTDITDSDYFGVYTSRADLYSDLAYLPQAQAMYQKAHTIAIDNSNTIGNRHIAESYYKVAIVNYKLQDFFLAKDAIDKAVNMLEKFLPKNDDYLQMALKWQSQINNAL